MKLGFYIADGYQNALLHNLYYGLISLGQTCLPYKKDERYDYVLVFNVAGVYARMAGGPWYTYTNLDSIQDKIVFIDAAEYGWWTHVDDYAPEYYNAFTPSAIRSKGPSQLNLLEFLRGKSFPYFIREKYKIIHYPKQYHAIDYTLYQGSEPTKKPDREEYMNRKYDVYLRWGTSHIFRSSITDLINSITGYKIDAEVAKVGATEYLSNTENSRISVVYDGYGSGSFRETEVLSRCTLFMHKQCIEKHAPLTHGKNVVEYTVNSKMALQDSIFVKGKPQYVDCNIVDLLKHYMLNWDLCFDIYKSGFDHCMTHYSPQGFSRYVLEKIQTHDYNEPTPLDLFSI